MEQNDLGLKQQEGFFHYSSVIGPARLIRKYASSHLVADAAYITNAFGVKVDPKVCPELLSGHEGEVEPLPIPSNWHADMAEFGAALRAVDLARETFTMIELGCGWGCWMNNTGVAARKKGLAVKLIGVEGDPGHVTFANEMLAANGFAAHEYSVRHGIAASAPGNALFPLQEHSGQSWGLEPRFDVSDSESAELVRTGRYMLLQQHALQDLVRDIERVDFLHVDIQGGEATLIPAAIELLSSKVAYLFIGTHSREIEGKMYACMLRAGWVLEIERPAIMAPGPHPTIVVDGVQAWRNPMLLPTVDIAEPHGALKLTSGTHGVHVGEAFAVRVKISNQSTTDWLSVGHTPVMATYKWVHPDRPTSPIEGRRTRLDDGGIGAGETTGQLVEIIAPSEPGSYELQLTLVQEGVRWFDLPEFEYEKVRVTVAPTKR